MILSSVPGIGYAAVWGTMSARALILHGAHLDYRYALLAAFWSIYQGFRSGIWAAR
jgi:hypothetical protein